jgi:hypothetical protein
LNAPAPEAAAFPALSRRRWLKWSLGAAGALVGGAGGGVAVLRGSAPAVAGLKVLSAHQYRTMAALASALLPRGGPFPQGAEDFDLARAFDGYLADEPPWAQRESTAALLLLELGPVLFARRLATFSNLSAEERLAHFESWAASESALRREVALGLRRFLSVLFYDSPAVWPALSYDGPLVKESP